MKRPDEPNLARRELYLELREGSLSIGQATRRMRKIVGKSQVEFAELLGITLRILREIEKDQGNPTLKTLQKIGILYGLKIGFVRKSKDPQV